MNETNKIIRVSAENGYEPCVKEYPIVFSALEALTKFACERLGLDYNKAKDRNKARLQMGVSRNNSTAYFYKRHDVFLPSSGRANGCLCQIINK